MSAVPSTKRVDAKSDSHCAQRLDHLYYWRKCFLSCKDLFRAAVLHPRTTDTRPPRPWGVWWRGACLLRVRRLAPFVCCTAESAGNFVRGAIMCVRACVCERARNSAREKERASSWKARLSRTRPLGEGRTHPRVCVRA